MVNRVLAGFPVDCTLVGCTLVGALVGCGLIRRGIGCERAGYRFGVPDPAGRSELEEIRVQECPDLTQIGPDRGIEKQELPLHDLGAVRAIIVHRYRGPP